MIPPKPSVVSDILLVQTPIEKHLFQGYSDFNPDVVVVVGFHIETQPLTRCLHSIAKQNLANLQVLVLIGNDSKSDIMDLLGDFNKQLKITILDICTGKAAQSRNMLLDYIDQRFEKTLWVARLDADDELASPEALCQLVEQGEISQANFVIGGNVLRADGEIVGTNRAQTNLKTPKILLKQLKEMADGTAKNELPSCNLLMRSHTGARYPHHHSAEDHWLLTELLSFRNEQVHIAKGVIYAIYSLDGNTTNTNQTSNRYYSSRRQLYQTAKQWCIAKKNNSIILGFGNEGIVYVENSYVIKQFYDDAIDDKIAQHLAAIETTDTILPRFKMYKEGNRWFCKYKKENTQPFFNASILQIKQFLLNCLKHDLVPLNIKRDNLRITATENIKYIDIGNDIKPLSASVFLDISARLYAISILNIPDSYIFRYPTAEQQFEVLERLPGFSEFYRNLLMSHNKRLLSDNNSYKSSINKELTLLIKCCAMDADYVDEQIPHIIHGLESPTRFCQKIVLIDSFEGPFLREHARGNINNVIQSCEKYKAIGLIDDIWLFPKSEQLNQRINKEWFDCISNQTHSIKQVPIISQLWAFEKIESRYVLQCDLDVIIGRRDYKHDYINEMLTALQQDKKAFCCGFNIPKDPSGSYVPYSAPDGSFVPEVRLGMLDLHRIRSQRPFPNTVVEGKLSTSWYRSVELYQKQNGWKSLRGGSPLTFYIHPLNETKKDRDFLKNVRQLCEIGQVPSSQNFKWDLEYQPNNWKLPKRYEDVVFLIKGRNVFIEKIKRCIQSLKIQDDQRFGIVLIDDCSDDGIIRHYPSMLNSLQNKTTFIKRQQRVGRMPNFITGIKEVCQNPDSLIVILDMDDALMHPSVVSALKQKLEEGHDLIQAGVFRPDKPLKQYQPYYSGNIRNEYGNDTWSHLRSFKKSLFDLIPESYFKMNDQWLEECTDYATMIPLVELAKNPVFIDSYMYLHERSTLNPNKNRKAEIIQSIVKKKPISH